MGKKPVGKKNRRYSRERPHRGEHESERKISQLSLMERRGPTPWEEVLGGRGETGRNDRDHLDVPGREKGPSTRPWQEEEALALRLKGLAEGGKGGQLP